MRVAPLEHPTVVRLCHWLAALTIGLLTASGLEIFAAFAGFGDKIPQHDVFMPPRAIRLGGWLGGALQWHLTCAWLFLATGATYVIYQAATGHYRQVASVSDRNHPKDRAARRGGGGWAVSSWVPTSAQRYRKRLAHPRRPRFPRRRNRPGHRCCARG